MNAQLETKYWMKQIWQYTCTLKAKTWLIFQVISVAAVVITAAGHWAKLIAAKQSLLGCS